MTCDEFESRILASQENELSADARAAGEKHLTACAACQALGRQLERLDAALTIQIKAPVLSADFHQRLAGRIQAETTVLPVAQRAERMRQLQAEYAAGLAQLRRTSLRLTDLWEVFPHVVLAALAGGLMWRYRQALPDLLSAQGLSGANQTLLLAAAAGAVFLAIGLAAAFPRRVRQFWSLV